MRTKFILARLKRVGWVKPDKHPFRILDLEICQGVLWALGMVILSSLFWEEISGCMAVHRCYVMDMCYRVQFDCMVAYLAWWGSHSCLSRYQG